MFFSLAVSLFNAILLVWLGLTVLLAAERRHWVIGVAGSGLLLGGAFFISHAAIIARGVLSSDMGMVVWWAGGLLPAVLLPYGWYGIMRWYAGVGQAGTAQRRLQRLGILVTSALLVGGLLITILLFGLYFIPLGLTGRVLTPRSSIPGFSWLALLLSLVYSGYLLLCTGLSLDALRHPGPSARAFGQLARKRARPWLLASTGGLLVVGLLVSAIMLYTVYRLHNQSFVTFYIESWPRLLLIDALVATLIAGVVLLLGQAIVAYEVFTGKTLPRRDLLRHWQGAVLLAGGYSVLIGVVFALDLRQIYALLLTALLMVVFYALFSWRTFAAQERLIASLRPFVAGPSLYDQLLTGGESAASPALDARPLATLCREILAAEFAYLVPLGPLATLVGAPVVFPAGRRPVPAEALAALAPRFAGSATICEPLDGDRFAGAAWAVPLWREQGLSGLLLLGPRRDGGLYTQEAIEIARSSGERLLDLQASAELARRLMSVQRRRLAESQVVDRRARRVLHDDILPLLHTALLKVSQVTPEEDSRRQVIELLGAAHAEISELLHQMPTGAAPEISRVGLLGALRNVVEQELGQAFDRVTWRVDERAGARAEALPPLTAEVVFYAAREAIRNAARYGRGPAGESAPLVLEVTARTTTAHVFQLTIHDNGVGVAATQELDHGSGQGLTLHSTMMAVVGGELAVESETGQGTKISITLNKEQ